MIVSRRAAQCFLLVGCGEIAHGGLVKSERAAESSVVGADHGSACEGFAVPRRVHVSSAELPVILVLDNRREYVLLPSRHGGMLMNARM